MTSPWRVAAYSSVTALSPAAWDRLVPPDNPFLEHAFLAALEASGSVGHGSGWQPHVVALEDADGLAAAVPIYRKTHSWGEYIFDWAWADAYRRAGRPYYPKGVVAAPFTPAAPGRLLIRPDLDPAPLRRALAVALKHTAEAQGWSGVHALFVTEAEADALSASGYLPRVTLQFQWENRGYATFDDFLDDLRSKKRKQVRRERQRAQSEVEVVQLRGDDLTPQHLLRAYRFYQASTMLKGSMPYLNARMFELLHARFRDRLLLVEAWHGGEPVAMSLSVVKGKRLCGRYWGAVDAFDALHFECCYYQLIDYAIAHGLDVVEAGAQGEHKFLRGFVARPIHSAHWLIAADARIAIGEYLSRERAHYRGLIAAYNRRAPVKTERARALAADADSEGTGALQ